ncbi:hypothetical protein BGW80DRAFT_1321793 [Lactifluus volemus]|nr:hypothetical protein BGW80DRAFT_1193791 [Lactifluus volemus]KAH9971327.1 hypothetical protein BGW80DRAFT_1321793 [Lactifluus volemus]
MKQLYFTRVLNRDPSRLNKFKIRTEDPQRRKHMVFPGGAVLADIMKAREEFWVSKRSGTRRACARSIYWVVGKVEQLRRL